MSTRPPQSRDVDLELLGKVARLHYDFGLTHHEIGEILRLSRVRVTRLLQQAREVGVVQIEVRTESSPYVAVEIALTQTFQLDEALIVPEFDDGARLRSALARSAAGYLLRVLGDGMTIAVSLSRTIALIPSHIDAPRPVDACFVSLVGGVRSSSEAMNSYESAERLAQLFGGTAEHLHAPLVVATADAARAFLEEPTIAQTLRRARSADVALVGLGGVGDGLNLVAEGYMTSAGWDGLVADGMVGDIGARYFDANGVPVENDVDDRIVGLTLDEIRRIPLRVVVAGGRDKDRAIHAALRTGLTSVLVTDAGTAARVLDAHRRS